MIFDREQYRRRLSRSLTTWSPSMPGFLLDEILRQALAALDEQLDQPVDGPTHPPAELVVDRIPDVLEGMVVACDGRHLSTRYYYRRGGG